MDDFGWLPPPKGSSKSDSLDTFLVGTLPELVYHNGTLAMARQCLGKIWTDKIRVFNSGADA